MAAGVPQRTGRGCIVSKLECIRLRPHTYDLCHVCRGEHYIDNCPDVLEADERMEALEAEYQERHREPEGDN